MLKLSKLLKNMLLEMVVTDTMKGDSDRTAKQIAHYLDLSDDNREALRLELSKAEIKARILIEKVVIKNIPNLR